MLFILASILSFFSFANALHIDDFFSKTACPVPLQNILKENAHKKYKLARRRKSIRIKRKKKIKIIKKSKEKKGKSKKTNLVLEKKLPRPCYLINDEFKRRHKASIIKYKGKYFLMVDNEIYTNGDYIEDYKIYKIGTNSVILEKNNKYYIWIL